jgi:hypothetical protein
MADVEWAEKGGVNQTSCKDVAMLVAIYVEHVGPYLIQLDHSFPPNTARQIFSSAITLPQHSQ